MMDDALSAFVSSLLLLSLGSYAVVFVIRRSVETFRPSVKARTLYTELMLPVAPIIVGACLGWSSAAIVPEPIAASTAGRALFGAVAGLLSAFTYSRARSFLRTTNTPQGG